jgi:hypothetical protein
MTTNSSKLDEAIKWLFPPGKLYKGIPIVVTTLAALVALFDRFIYPLFPTEFLGANSRNLYLIIIHLILVLTFIISRFNYDLDIKELIKSNPKIFQKFIEVKNITEFKLFSNQALESLEKFIKYWIFTCVIWFIHYLIKLFQLIFITEPEENEHFATVFDLSFNLLNYASTFTLLACYIIITYPTFKKGKFQMPVLFLIWGIVFGSIFLFEIFYRFLNSSSESSNEYILIIFGVIGGVISCIFFSLLIGRLDNKLLNISNFAIGILFLYASIQAFYPLLHFFLNRKNTTSLEGITLSDIDFWIILFALIAKSVLFFVLLIGEKNHRLFIFMVFQCALIKNYEPRRKEVYKLLDF